MLFKNLVFFFIFLFISFFTHFTNWILYNVDRLYTQQSLFLKKKLIIISWSCNSIMWSHLSITLFLLVHFSNIPNLIYLLLKSAFLYCIVEKHTSRYLINKKCTYLSSNCSFNFYLPTSYLLRFDFSLFVSYIEIWIISKVLQLVMPIDQN